MASESRGPSGPVAAGRPAAQRRTAPSRLSCLARNARQRRGGKPAQAVATGSDLDPITPHETAQAARTAGSIPATGPSSRAHPEAGRKTPARQQPRTPRVLRDKAPLAAFAEPPMPATWKRLPRGPQSHGSIGSSSAGPGRPATAPPSCAHAPGLRLPAGLTSRLRDRHRSRGWRGPHNQRSPP